MIKNPKAIVISHPETFHKESLITQRDKWQEVRVVGMPYFEGNLYFLIILFYFKKREPGRRAVGERDS